MLLKIDLSAPLHNSFRVQQIAGMFDVPLPEKLHHQISINLPNNFLVSLPAAASALHTAATAWRIGLILGPSGAGKTTLARRLFGPNFIERIDWPEGRALIDCFEDLRTTIQELTHLLTAVGLSSPPTWIKPYQVLSTGEQFRADLARALATALLPAHSQSTLPTAGTLPAAAGPLPTPPLIAIDEFTSTLNRPLARIASAALAKSIRSGSLPVRFVAVTCHDDIAPWLAPDWIIDMATRQFRWVRLRTPAIKLQIARCHHSAWQTFAPHHYLSGNLNKSARCFLARWQNESVAFCATLPAIGRKSHRRISRLVTLPDYQGVGIGTRLLEEVAQIHAREGHRVTITASHPALIAHCTNSKSWRLTRIAELGSRPNKHAAVNYNASPLRPTITFAYQPEASARRRGPTGQPMSAQAIGLGRQPRDLFTTTTPSTAPATPPTAPTTRAPSQTQPTRRSYRRR